jgi:hypothetical protein
MYRHGPFEQFYRKMADMSPFVIHFLVQRMSALGQLLLFAARSPWPDYDIL